MNMGVSVFGTSNQLFIRNIELKQNFQKNKVVTGKTPFLVIGLFCIHDSIF